MRETITWSFLSCRVGYSAGYILQRSTALGKAIDNLRGTDQQRSLVPSTGQFYLIFSIDHFNGGIFHCGHNGFRSRLRFVVDVSDTAGCGCWPPSNFENI